MKEAIDAFRIGANASFVSRRLLPSLEALKAYSMAFKVLTTSGGAAAVPLYQRATEIDPQFAMAYAMLGRVYGDIAESDLSEENTTKAWQLGSRVNDRELFLSKPPTKCR